MADQIPSLKELAKSISEDIAEKFKLSSDSSIMRMLLKELESLSSSNKLLARVTEESNKDKGEVSIQSPQLLEPRVASNPPKPIDEKPNLESNLPKILSSSLKSAVGDLMEENQKTNEPKSELEEIEKPKDVRIIGIDEAALKGFKLAELIGKPLESLAKKLTDFGKGIENSIGKIGDNKEGEGLLNKLLPKGSLIALTGATLVLGGLAALTAAFNTDGESKGTLELIGKGGLKGGLAMLAKTVFKKVGVGLLKKIPIIGSLISYGFAIQRFMNGDVVGGIIELVSGTVGLIPGPVGIALSTGVDVVQAILDAKAGGSSAEASAKKADILKGWAETLKDKVISKIEKVPILGDFVKIGKSLVEGNNEKALEQLTAIIPALHWVKTVVRSKTALSIASASLSTAGNILTTIGDWISGKISKIFSPILEFFTKNEKTVLAEAEKIGEEVIPKAKGILTPIKDAIVNFGKKVIEQLGKIFSPLTTVFQEIGENIAKKGTWVLDKAKGLLTPIGEGIEKLGKTLMDHLEGIYKPVKNFFMDMGDNILKKGVGLLDDVKVLLSPLTEGIERLAKTLTGHVEGLFTPVKNFFGEMGESILKKGTGLLDNVKGLLSPITEGVEKLGKTVLEHLDDMFKPIKGFLGDIVETLSKKASSFIAPITDLVESIGSKLFSIGDDVFKVFKNTFSGMVGAAAGATVEGVAGKSLLGKLTGFIPKFLGGVTKFLKGLPLIGSIISIGSLAARLMNSEGPDYVGAAIEALSIISGIFLPGMGISLALDVLNGVLDYKAEPGKDGKRESKIDILGRWVSEAGDWLYEKLIKIPYIGPMIEVGKLIVTDPIGALKALGDTFPALGSVVNMFESTFPSLFQGDTSSVGFTDIFNSIGKWVYNKITDWPVIGPLLKAWNTFTSDPIGILKTLGTTYPIVDKILSFFDVGPKKATAGLTFAENASTSSFSFDGIIKWIQNKILEFPIIGPLIKSLQEFIGDPIGVLRGLGESIPVIKNIMSFFDTKFELRLPEMSFQFKNPFDGLNEMISNKAKEWWDNATGWISNLNPFKSKEKELVAPQPNSEVKRDDQKESVDPSLSTTPKQVETPVQPSTQPATRRGGQIKPAPTSNAVITGDAFIAPPVNSQKGFSISSPEVGALWQLDKRDGIIAGPVANSKPQIASTNSFAKAELILERIAGNTATSNQNISNLIVGFNNLAKALEKTLGESVKVPVVVNTGSNQQGPISPTTSQLANAGNNSIFDFRTRTVEGARPQPA